MPISSSLFSMSYSCTYWTSDLEEIKRERVILSTHLFSTQRCQLGVVTTAWAASKAAPRTFLVLHSHLMHKILKRPTLENLRKRLTFVSWTSVLTSPMQCCRDHKRACDRSTCRRPTGMKRRGQVSRWQRQTASDAFEGLREDQFGLAQIWRRYLEATKRRSVARHCRQSSQDHHQRSSEENFQS